MKSLIPALALLVGLSAGGCAISPTDLSSIEVGAPRATVESRLGQPVSSEKTDIGSVDTYEYNQGAGPTDLDLADGCRPGDGECAVGLLIALPVIVGTERFIAYVLQRAEVVITYGSEHTVVELQFDPVTAAK